MSNRNKNRNRNKASGMLPVPTSGPMGIPVATGPQGGAILSVQAQATISSGPLPAPEILKQYNEVVPGAAERIIKMAEQQLIHRQKLESQVVTSDIWKSYWGLAAAFVLALLMIIGGSVVTALGQPVAGGAIATASVIGLVWAFLEGTRARREERAERARMMTGR